MNNIAAQYYDDSKNLWGEPQRYKDLLLFPIKIKDIGYKDLFFQTMFYPKKYTNIKQIMKLSYLKYFIFVVFGNNEELKKRAIDNLTLFLKYILRCNSINIVWEWQDLSRDGLDMGGVKIIVDDVEIAETDFDNIREIILLQNGWSIEYIEQFDPDLEESLQVFRNKNYPNFEEKIFILASLLGKTIFELQEYTLYQLDGQLKRLMSILEYKSFKPLEVSGQISSKNGDEIISHYLVHFERENRYDSILIEKDKFVKDSDLFKASQQGMPRGIGM